MDIIKSIEQEQLRKDIPLFFVGDTVRVQVKVVEGTRERLQAFEGVVIKKQNGGARETFTVRRMSYGIGVERTFPMHSPRVGSVEIVRKGKVRRAKLYYLRERSGKSAKIKEGARITKADKIAAAKAEPAVVEALAVEAPAAEAPKAEAPKKAAPKKEAAKAEVKKEEKAAPAESPKAEAPKEEAPKEEAEKTEE